MTETFQNERICNLPQGNTKFIYSVGTQPLENCVRAIKIAAKLHCATSIIMIIQYFKNIVLRLQVPANGKQAISHASRTIPWEACRFNPYLTFSLYYSIMIVKISGLRSKWKYLFLGSQGSKKCEMHEKGFWNFWKINLLGETLARVVSQQLTIRRRCWEGREYEAAGRVGARLAWNENCVEPNFIRT